MPGSLDLDKSVLPSHLPQRPLSLFDGRSISGRRRGRRARRRTAWLLTESLWGALTFFEIGGSPDSLVLARRLGEWEISFEQQVQFFFLYEHIGAMCRLVPATGRGAQRLDSHVLYHEDSLLSSSATNHTIEKLANTVAKPVLAHRAKIPAVAATVLHEKYLKGRRRHLFEHQELL